MADDQLSRRFGKPAHPGEPKRGLASLPLPGVRILRRGDVFTF